MEQTDRAVTRNLIIATVLGVILSRFGIGSIFLTVPLLLACRNLRKTSHAMVAFTVLLVAVSAWNLVIGREMMASEYRPAFWIGLFLPVSTIIGSALWIALRDYTSSLLRRFFLCCIPVYAIGLATSVYFASDAARLVRELYAQVVLYYLPSESLGVDLTAMVLSVVESLKLIFAPMAVIMFAIPVCLSDILSHRYDDQWQFDFANMKFPDSYVWGFLASWALALGCNFFGSVPSLVAVFAWNTALVMAILYGIVGISILVAFARRRTTAISAGRIVFTVILLCMLPVLNVAVIIALPVLGVLETWVRFR